jgi:hypothetical protein
MRPSDEAHHHFMMRFTILRVCRLSARARRLYGENVMRITKW